MLSRILRRFSLVRHLAKKVRKQRKELRAYRCRVDGLIVECDTWMRTVFALRDRSPTTTQKPNEPQTL